MDEKAQNIYALLGMRQDPAAAPLDPDPAEAAMHHPAWEWAANDNVLSDCLAMIRAMIADMDALSFGSTGS